ncbi:MAG: polyphenol oxidase family protein [Candidatus Gastranaerophilales bacterium]|nr:polyphenol oxidase family protein [Candidatus Gastranaerophilales bacterium]
MFRMNEQNGIKYFTSTKLEGLHHAFTTRGLDMKNSTDRQKLLVELGFVPRNPNLFIEESDNQTCFQESERNYPFIMPKQEHTANIALVENAWDAKKDFAAIDGVIITVPNIPVMLCFADCVPVVLFSRKDNVLALLHAGWRGTAAGIVKKCCKILIDEMGLDPKNITMAIGASICLDAFETSKEVKEALSYSMDGDYEEVFIDNHADLKKINAYQAMETGIVSIDVMEYCTSRDNDLFYSYRKENQTQYRHGVVAQLKEELG